MIEHVQFTPSLSKHSVEAKVETWISGSQESDVSASHVAWAGMSFAKGNFSEV